MTETLSFSHEAPEKVKAVAAAIYAAIADRKSSFDVARAAIEAMSAPTEAMITAFINATVNQWGTIEGLKKGLTAAIQAALTEGTGE